MGGWEVKPDMPEGSQRDREMWWSRRLTVDSNIHHIRPRSSSSEHRCGRDTGSVVRVNVDREVRMLLTNCTDQPVEG